MTDTFLHLTIEEMVWELEDLHWDRLPETEEGPRVIRQGMAVAVGRPVTARAPRFGSSGTLSSNAASAVLVLEDETCDMCLGETGFWEQVLSTDQQAGESDAGNVGLTAEAWAKLVREEEGINPILSNSLDELKDAPAQAEEEDWPRPTSECVERTERLLKKMFEIKPHPYWVYPTPNRELVIDGGYEDRRIIVTLPHEGGAIYTYRASNTGELHAVESADSDNLPDREMHIVLTRIGGGHDSA